MGAHIGIEVDCTGVGGTMRTNSCAWHIRLGIQPVGRLLNLDVPADTIVDIDGVLAVFTSSITALTGTANIGNGTIHFR